MLFLIMADKRFEKVYKIENLKLAWNRINTSTTNLFYKDYYRDLFWYYEMTLEKNLELLSERLKNHTYEFQIPVRFYKPKQSGLQRPFSLLSIEDQIVYQAMANVIVPDLLSKRRKYELKTVFSNIFSDNPNNNIYLLHNWKYGYYNFKNTIKQNFENNKTYTAHFDLAAFFDTIDHHSLTSSVLKKTDSEYGQLLQEALRTWSNTKKTNSKKILHSIPQGPVASIVFSELFLLPIDEKMSFQDSYSYSRYVDDIVIQGTTKNDVLKAIIQLEQLCKEKGLVPQSSKFEIFKAESVEMAIGKRPSLTDDEKEYIFGNTEILKKEFKEAFNKDSFDGSKIRYILKTYKKADVLIPIILSKFNDFYEYSEDFINYLENFVDSKGKEYISFFGEILLSRNIPYGFVNAQIWNLLKKVADYEPIPLQLDLLANNRLGEKIKYDEKYGILNYLSKNHGQSYYYNIGFEQSSIFQELTLKFLSLDLLNDYYAYLAFDQFEKRSLVELNIIFQNAQFYLNLVNNTFFSKHMGLAKIPNKSNYEIIQYTLKDDYEIANKIDWKTFFGKDYPLASTLIYHAHLSKDINKTAWLNLTDSFNDILIRTFIELLKIKKLPSTQWPSTINRNSELIDIGNILKQTCHFTTVYSSLCSAFNILHVRRSADLLSHAKDKKTTKPNSFVSSREQGNLIKVYKPELEKLIHEIEIL